MNILGFVSQTVSEKTTPFRVPAGKKPQTRYKWMCVVGFQQCVCRNQPGHWADLTHGPEFADTGSRSEVLKLRFILEFLGKILKSWFQSTFITIQPHYLGRGGLARAVSSGSQTSPLTQWGRLPWIPMCLLWQPGEQLGQLIIGWWEARVAVWPPPCRVC